MRLAHTLTSLILGTFIALPIIAADLQGTITGKVGCGKRCGDVLVFVDGLGGTFSGEGEVAVFDQKDKVFMPHILPILKGTTVRMLNSDPFLHNVHVYAGKRGLFNLAIPANGKAIERTFEEVGTHTILCDVHPEMSAFVVVLDNPYFSTVGADGSFRIDNVPAGTHTVVLYHPKRGKRIEQTLSIERGSVQVEFLTGK